MVSSRKNSVEYPIRLVQFSWVVLKQPPYMKKFKNQCVLCFDMGGTTAKACLIENGKPNRTTIFEVARFFVFKKWFATASSSC